MRTNFKSFNNFTTDICKQTLVGKPDLPKWIMVAIISIASATKACVWRSKKKRVITSLVLKQKH